MGLNNRPLVFNGAGAVYTTGTTVTPTIGTLPNTYGGTGADLSATGGTGKVVKQLSIGAAFTVGNLTTAEIGNAGGTAGTDTVLRGDLTWQKAVTDTWSVGKDLIFTGTGNGLTTSIGLWSDSSGNLYANAYTACDVKLATAGTTQLSVGTTGAIFPVNQSIPSSSYGICRYNTASLILNVPTGKNIQMVEQGATVTGAFNSGGLYFPNSLTGISTQNGLYCTSNILVANAVSGGQVTLAIAGTGAFYTTASLATLDTANGLKLGSSSGTITSTIRQISGASTGIVSNTPSGTNHGFYINNVLKGIVEDKWMSNGILAGSRTDITCFGYQAGNNLASGSTANTFLGYQAGYYLTNSSSYNVMIGPNAGPAATNNQSGSVFIGYYAGQGVSSGGYNMALGYAACYMGAATPAGTGSYNIWMGYFAGPNTSSLSTAAANVGIGKQVFQSLTTGSDNIGIGSSALALATTPTYQIAIGLNSLGGATNTGTLCVGVGVNSLYLSTSASYCTAMGYNAGYGLTDATNCIAIGRSAMSGTSANTPDGNIAIGYQALLNPQCAYGIAIGYGAMAGASGVTGTRNTALGTNCLNSVTSGSYNVSIGDNSGSQITTGASNLCIGPYRAGYGLTTATTAIAIGYSALGGTASGAHSDNIAIGYQAMYNAGSASAYNIAMGYQAMATGTNTGTCNVAIGRACLGNALTSGSGNLALGYFAGYNATTMAYSISLGYQAIGSGTCTATDVISIGQRSGYALTSGSYNLFAGSYSGESATTTSGNVALGYYALNSISTGTGYNVAIGYTAGRYITGSNNVAIGNNTITVTSGSRNIEIGYSAAVGSATSDDQICIGGAYIRDSSGNIKLYQGSSGSTLIYTATSSALTLASGVKFILTSGSAPSTASDTGTAGTIAWDTGYLYVCTATNTWKRVALATW